MRSTARRSGAVEGPYFDNVSDIGEAMLRRRTGEHQVAMALQARQLARLHGSEQDAERLQAMADQLVDRAAGSPMIRRALMQLAAAVRRLAESVSPDLDRHA
jgi:hypothetical protein